MLLATLLALLLPATVAYAQPTPPRERQNSGRTFLPLMPLSAGSQAGRGLLPPSDQMQTYQLQEGDDLAELAFDLGRDVSLMACVTPDGTVPLSDLRPGQVIVVPSANYVCHTVQSGETLADVAALYQVAAELILETPWNRLEDGAAELAPGRRLLVFGGVRPEQAPRQIPPAQPAAAPEAVPPVPADQAPPQEEIWPYGDGEFVWPSQGPISQDHHSGHKAIDIAARFGDAVVAADNGVVKKVGWATTGYGLRVIIDHNIDYVTLYAHLSEVYVEEGEVVEKGQLIGLVGSTGNSTGPHVHFEIRDFGYLIDPLSLLPE